MLESLANNEHVQFQLAQINLARARGPLTDPVMEGFVSQIEAMNLLAEQSPGFVWGLKGEGGSSSSYVRAFEDERMLINISVWNSIEALQKYVYRSGHSALFRDRRDWFEPLTSPGVALWWVRNSVLPSIAEAQQRLAYLAQHGPTPYAFTFKRSFPPSDVVPPGSSDCNSL